MSRSHPAAACSTAFLLDVRTAPMEAKVGDALPDGGDRQFVPRWDGFHCLAYRSGASVDLRAQSGKPLGRHLPEMTAAVTAANAAAERSRLPNRG